MLISPFLVLVLIGVTEAELLIAKEDYDSINVYLEAHVSKPNVKANMDKALEWLGSMEKDRNKDFFLYISLKAFTNLNKVQGDCSIASAKLIQENHIACDKGSLREKPERRIDIIVNKIAQDHANECLMRWNQMYQSMVSKDQQVLFTILDSIIKSHSQDLSDRALFEDYVRPSRTKMLYKIDGPMDAKLVVDQLSKLTKKDRNHSSLRQQVTDGRTVNLDKLLRLLEHNLLAPCNNYLSEVREIHEHLLPELAFAMAKPKGSKTGESNIIVRGLARARLCEYIKYTMSPLIYSQKSPQSFLIQVGNVINK